MLFFEKARKVERTEREVRDGWREGKEKWKSHLLFNNAPRAKLKPVPGDSIHAFLLGSRNSDI